MTKLRGFTLAFDHQKENWRLRNNSTGQVVRRFDTKKEATKRGVLRSAVGSQGGSVRIEKQRGGSGPSQGIETRRSLRASLSS